MDMASAEVVCTKESSSMMEAFIQFSAAAIVIVFAGTWLAHFADQISDETGLGKLLVGSVFLAGATSLPEITVDMNAIALGQPDLAVGDLLGSSLFNLLILMVVSAYFCLSEKTNVNFRQHAITATFSIALTTMVALGMVAHLELSFLRAGLFTWLILILYIAGLWLLLKTSAPDNSNVQKTKTGRIASAVSGYIACAILLLLVAPYLAEAADKLATASGLGHSFIGTTLVALSTSLPELVTTIVAFRMGSPDLALGNIFGSNMFNMVIFLPLDWYYTGNLLRAADSINIVTALGVIFVTSIATVTLLVQPVTRKGLIAGNAFVASSAIVILWLLYYLKKNSVL